MICTLCTRNELEFGSLCRSCTRTTHDRLVRLPRMWSALEAWLTPGPSGSAHYGGRARLAEAPLPVSTEVLDLRAAGGIVGVLEDWREAVHHTRGLGRPVRSTSLTSRVVIAADDLDSHLDWIARWYAGADFGRDIRRLVDRVHAVIGPDHPERTLLGHCVAVDSSGVSCGSRIYADMSRPVQCGRCHCAYPPSTWLTLRRLQPGNLQHDEAGHGQEPVAA